MSLEGWPGRERAATMRQWPALVALADRVAAADALEGLVLLGSFAAGTADELSDIDAIAVARRGLFPQAWEERRRLSQDALVSWDLSPRLDARGHNWLTRDLVKIDCTIVDPDSGGKDLAAPYVVCVGPPELADRFPRVPLAVVRERARRIAEEQSRLPVDPETMDDGELIDWKLSELKHAVRRARGAERRQG
jgi:hypothetical protein